MLIVGVGIIYHGWFEFCAIWESVFNFCSVSTLDEKFWKLLWKKNCNNYCCSEIVATWVWSIWLLRWWLLFLIHYFVPGKLTCYLMTLRWWSASTIWFKKKNSIEYFQWKCSVCVCERERELSGWKRDWQRMDRNVSQKCFLDAAFQHYWKGLIPLKIIFLKLVIGKMGSIINHPTSPKLYIYLSQLGDWVAHYLRAIFEYNNWHLGRQTNITADKNIVTYNHSCKAIVCSSLIWMQILKKKKLV